MGGEKRDVILGGDPGPVNPFLRPVVPLRKRNGETVAANSAYRVYGAAWTGAGEITRVEVSCDSGQNWRDAKLLGESVKNAWRLWEYEWRTPAAGRHQIIARATDSRGFVQSTGRSSDRGTYMINHLLPIEVEVR